MDRTIFSLVVFLFYSHAVRAQAQENNFHVAKLIFSEDGVRCSGSLISKDYIITTGHCTIVEGVSGKMIPDSVQFGTDAPVKIANITRHYRFKPHLDYHNLALIKLEPPGVNVQPACLWMEDKFDYANFDVIGRDETESPISTSVQHLSVEKCHEYYDLNTKLRFGVIHNQICTINEESRKCPTDFGGPLQRTFVLQNKPIPFIFGLKSLGQSCATPVPGVYTRLSSYKAWIEAIVGESFDHEACAVRFGSNYFFY